MVSSVRRVVVVSLVTGDFLGWFLPCKDRAPICIRDWRWVALVWGGPPDSEFEMRCS